MHLEQPQQPYDEDEHSGELREYNGVFEGPEKTLGKCNGDGMVGEMSGFLRKYLTHSFVQFHSFLHQRLSFVR